MGFGALALGSMLARDGVVRADDAIGEAHASRSPAKAKCVIWIFLIGGMSQMESFDPKPELNKYADKTIEESPYKATLESPYLKKNLREVIEGLHKVHPKIFPMQVGYRQFGQSGLEMSDWWARTGELCADDLCLVRSMWTTDNNHGAQIQFHTGRHSLEGPYPTIGSWVHYGLGSLNDNLPQFVVLGTPLADCCGGVQGHGANYLGPSTTASSSSSIPKTRCRSPRRTRRPIRKSKPASSHLLGRLNRLSAAEYPDDPALAARIKSYELAYQMQAAVPDVVNFAAESAETQRLYGLDQPATKTFGGQCLAARRMVERGVRFVQLFHGSNGGAGAWDAHGNLKDGHSKLCGQVDQPIAGLIHDLKRRGLLGRNAGRHRHRIRPHARCPGQQRPRPSSLRLLDRAGRRRHPRRHRPRCDRRAGFPRGGEPPLRHRPARHGPASARPRPAAARNPRPQAAGDRLRRADPGDHGVVCGSDDFVDLAQRRKVAKVAKRKLIGGDGVSLSSSLRTLAPPRLCVEIDQVALAH